MTQQAQRVELGLAEAIPRRTGARWHEWPWWFTRRAPLGAVGAGLLIVLVLVAVFAPAIAPYDPIVQDVPNRLREPGGQFLLGTDIYGRDVFSRIVFGARISLYVGLFSVIIGTAAGTLVGVGSGYLGGRGGLLIPRGPDAMMGFPPLILAMVLVAAFGTSLNSVVISIAISLVPRMVRLSRSSALSIKNELYVTAAQSSGCTAGRIIVRHVLPNCLAPVFVLATGYMGTAIVVEASLSFLGLGVPPPSPSWGGMLQSGASGYLETAPWLTIFPGIALSAVTFGFALLGDALRDTLDPRLRGG